MRMKVQDRDIAPLGPSAQTPRRSAAALEMAGPDEFHLSDLVMRLRALAANSPERQERLEQIARSYAYGTYKLDADATASAILEDSLRYR